jgi:hypothetical protein
LIDKAFSPMEDILLRNLRFRQKKPPPNIRISSLINGFKGLEKKTSKNSGNSRNTGLAHPQFS